MTLEELPHPFQRACVTMSAIQRLGFDGAALYMGRTVAPCGHVHLLVILRHPHKAVSWSCGAIELDDAAMAEQAGIAMRTWNQSPQEAREALFRRLWTISDSMALMTFLRQHGISWAGAEEDIN